MSDHVRRRPPLTVPDLAAATGMSLDFFYTEIREGELVAVKFGRTYRIDADEVDRYLAQKRFPPIEGRSA